MENLPDPQHPGIFKKIESIYCQCDCCIPVVPGDPIQRKNGKNMQKITIQGRGGDRFGPVFELIRKEQAVPAESEGFGLLY